MKRILLLLVVATAAAVNIFGADHHEKALNKFIDDYIAALQKNSADATAPFLGDQYLRIGADGSSFTKEQMLAGLRSGDLKYTSVKAEERAWRTFGQDLAISTSRVTIKASFKGQDVSGTYRATTVLWKNGSAPWVLVSTHLSPVGAG